MINIKKQIENLSCTKKQKKILKIIYQFNEGWLSEDSLENELSKVFKK